MAQTMTSATFWILTVLADQKRHGYEILREVEQASGSEITLKVTTLYAALERLVRSGHIVEAGEEIVNGRARRYYALTDAGSSALTDEVAVLDRQVSAARERLGATRLAAVGHGILSASCGTAVNHSIPSVSRGPAAGLTAAGQVAG